MILREIEKKWQKRWGDEKLFEGNPDKREKFFLTFPYPYLNGPLHLGHAFTATRVDVLARFKRMRGFNVLFPFAWHVTGEPIAGVAERLKKGDKEQEKILRDAGVSAANLKKFQDPHEIIKFYKKKGKIDIGRLGLSVDWRREFTTTPLTPPFSRFIEWQYNTLKKGGYVKQGTHPVIWCPSCNSPTGDHDRLEGEGVAVVEYTLLKFDLDGSKLVAATLRPETIYGVTNFWINPSADYVKAEVDGENWIVSKAASEKLAQQKHTVKILEEFKGEKIIGKKCKNPVGNEVIILPADFVDPNNSTGAVMSVPAHAPFDHIALEDLKQTKWKPEIDKINYISLIKLDGYGEFPAVEECEKLGVKDQNDPKCEAATRTIYKAEFHSGVLRDTTPYAGKKVSEVKDMVIRDLRAKKVSGELFETGEKVVCRCNTCCNVNILENQWFLDYGNPDWKKQATEALNNCDILPGEALSAFKYTIGWLREKACARKGGLGTPLPWDKEWKVETLSDSTVYMAYYTIARVINEKKITAEQLTDETLDFIFLGKGKGPKWAEEMREEFEYWYPVNYRNSAKELVYNHLTFYLFHHTAIWPKKYWPTSIGVNGMLNVEGDKMSKSRGTFVTLADALDTYSADTTRMGLLNTAEGLTDPDWRKEYVSTLQRTLHRFLSLVNTASNKPCKLDDWLESRFSFFIEKATQYYEKTEFRSALQYAYFEPMNALKWYAQRGGTNTARFLRVMALLIAPITPHVAEEAWEKLGGKGFVSVAGWPEPKAKRDAKAELEEGLISSALSDVENIIKFKGITAKKCHLYISQKWKYDVRETITKKKERNPKEIISELMKDSNLRAHGNEIPRLVNRMFKAEGEILGPKEELEALKSATNFLDTHFGIKFTIHGEKPDYDPQNKASNAMPGKPAIYLE